MNATQAVKAKEEDNPERYFYPVMLRLHIATHMTNRLTSKLWQQQVDLNTHEVCVLQEVGKKEPISAREIAREISADEGQVSRTVKLMRERNLVRYYEDPVTTRKKMLILTTEGRKIFKTTNRISREFIDSIWDGIGKTEEARFYRTLEKLRCKVEEMTLESKNC